MLGPCRTRASTCVHEGIGLAQFKFVRNNGNARLHQSRTLRRVPAARCSRTCKTRRIVEVQLHYGILLPAGRRGGVENAASASCKPTETCDPIIIIFQIKVLGLKSDTPIQCELRIEVEAAAHPIL
ncbi:hypothetical protein EVAR_86093_1 [Eumeta japonica]|uniref:Uncharacterized protein n=1 Tax=Eumeta variegata TaxID=151549 RepID=A0A4C1V0K1_EUMVA|nr:hypothetical protein EVAR_86093_1 [Eumeta japonica]